MCGTVNATGTITVTPANTASASSTPTLCINTVLTVLLTTTGATGIGTATGYLQELPQHLARISQLVVHQPPGTFNYSIPLTGGCGAVNATGTITVTPATQRAASSTTLCTVLTNITHATTGATGIERLQDYQQELPQHLDRNTITISGTPTASGTFNYSIPQVDVVCECYGTISIYSPTVTLTGTTSIAENSGDGVNSNLLYQLQLM
jgi:hypothetical protein